MGFSFISGMPKTTLNELCDCLLGVPGEVDLHEVRLDFQHESFMCTVQAEGSYFCLELPVASSVFAPLHFRDSAITEDSAFH